MDMDLDIGSINGEDQAMGTAGGMATISGMAQAMDTDLDILDALQELMPLNPSALPCLP
jgi:hypothetical protein